MKFRTFITTLLLFLVMFYTSLLLISLFMFNTQMDMAKKRGISEHYLIASSFGKDLAAVSSRSSSLDDSIQPLFDFYVEYYNQQGVFLEIVKDGNILYSSVPKQFNIPKIVKEPTSGFRRASIEKYAGEVYVQVVGELPQIENKYFLHYLYTISDNLLAWKNMQEIMLLIGVAVTIILAIFLQLSLGRVFKPLFLISTASKKIAAGQYKNKIPVTGHDELTEMAVSFNNMADEIHLRITQLAEASENKQQFVDNFSHEVRTPLTSIYGYAEYLVKAAVSEEEKIESANYIMSECRHMLSIADHLLEIATLRNQEVSMRELYARAFFQSVKNSLNNKLAEKQIALDWKCGVAILYGEQVLLKSLLVNLTDNAIKACKTGGHILWETNIEQGNRVLLVSDDGKGMSLEQIEHITEPFYRIDKSRNRAKGGAGLGLSICEQIAACHNAILTFESCPNSGTIAKITFTTS